MKVQHKIILAFLMFTGIILVISCLLIYNVSAWQRKLDFQNRLKNRAATTASLLFEIEEVNESILKKVDSVTVNTLYNENIAIYDHTHKLLYSSAKDKYNTLQIDSDLFDKINSKEAYYFKIKNSEALAFYYPLKSGDAVVVITAEDKDGKKRLQQLLLLLVVTFGTGILLSVLAGWAFSKTILKPLNTISHNVKTISAKNIEKRLPERNINDEWEELTKTFNLLLSRLQQSFEIQGRFIANASHELSTPLTVITSQIDVALQQERSAIQYKGTLISVKDDLSHLTQLAKSLLEIARSAKGGSIQTIPIRIDELLLEVAAEIGKLSFSCKVKIHIDELPENEDEFTVNGNYDLLLSAFKNIAENACKYSSDQLVTVNVSFLSEKIVLLFRNKGQIAAADIDYLFYPFFRGQEAFQKKGYGMGLSIVQRIISLHKGEIKVENLENEEVLFTVVLPSAV
jgi:two-component system, OmpR family, sensor histidine kinase ArlS